MSTCAVTRGQGEQCARWFETDAIRKRAECGPMDCTYQELATNAAVTVGFLKVDYGICDSNCGALGIRGLRATSGDSYQESGRCSLSSGEMSEELLVLNIGDKFLPVMTWTGANGGPEASYVRQKVIETRLKPGRLEIIFERSRFYNHDEDGGSGVEVEYEGGAFLFNSGQTMRVFWGTVKAGDDATAALDQLRNRIGASPSK